MTVARAPLPRAAVCAQDRILRVLYTDSLKAIGFSVVPATEPSEIVRYSTIRQFHLVILDFLHAGTSSLEIASGLRDQGVSAPLLITTTVPADPVPKIEVSLVHVLMKPFDNSEFRDAVHFLCPELLLGPETFDQG